MKIKTKVLKNGIEKPKYREIGHIVKLHQKNLKDGLLYRLGSNALKLFYKEIFYDDGSLLLSYYVNGRIAGVAASTKDIDFLIAKIKKNNSLILAFSILKSSIKNPALPFQLLNSDYPSQIKSELLFLFVDKNFRGKGIGRKLVKATSSYFKKNYIKKYKITVLSSNAESREFYRRMGFIPAGRGKYMGQKRDIFKLIIR